MKLGSPLLCLCLSLKQISSSFVMSFPVRTSKIAFVIILTIVVIVCLQSYDSVMSLLMPLQQKLGSLVPQSQ